MAFRGEPQNIAEIVAWVQEQLRSIQSPIAGGSFVGPPGPQGAPGIQGDPGPVGPTDPDAETLLWATVTP